MGHTPIGLARRLPDIAICHISISHFSRFQNPLIIGGSGSCRRRADDRTGSRAPAIVVISWPNPVVRDPDPARRKSPLDRFGPF